MTNTGPLVSGIIIFLNGEAFIREAIESVVAQTYPRWELLLVDDGSTDRSTDIALEYAKAYPERVKYLDHEGHRNLGMSAARNVGIKAAKGTYIGFLDCDDVWLPHKLAEQVAIMEACPEAGMVYGRTRYWHSWTGKQEDQSRDSFTELDVPVDTVLSPPALVPVFLRNENALPGTCTALMRRDVVTRTGGFVDSFRDLYEDMVFWIKMAVEAPALVKDTCWAYYRQHDQSSCTVADRAGYWHGWQPNRPREVFLEWVVGYLSEKGVTDPAVWEALTKESWPYRHPIRYRADRFVNERVLPLTRRALDVVRSRVQPAIRRLRRRAEAQANS